jgi:hypothetical protein
VHEFVRRKTVSLIDDVALKSGTESPLNDLSSLEHGYDDGSGSMYPPY